LADFLSNQKISLRLSIDKTDKLVSYPSHWISCRSYCSYSLEQTRLHRGNRSAAGAHDISPVFSSHSDR